MPLSDCTIATTTEVIDPTMTVPGVVMSSATVTQGGNVLAAIGVTWTAISNPYVTGVQIEYVPHGASVPKITTTPQPGVNLAWTGSDGVVSGKQYDVRYRAAGVGNVFGSWSGTTTVTAGTASVGASSLPAIDPANFILDPNFYDSVYWTYSGACAVDSSADVTGTIGALQGIKHTASGANPQTDSYATTTALLPCSPGAPYTVSMQQLNKSGFKGQGGMVVTFYKQDGVTSVGSGTVGRGSLVGTDYRTTPAAGDQLETVTATLTSPALAAFMSVKWQCDWPNAAASAGVLYQGFPNVKSVAASALDTTVSAGATKTLSYNLSANDSTDYNTTNNGAAFADATTIHLGLVPLGGTIIFNLTASYLSNTTGAKLSWQLVIRNHTGGGDSKVLAAGSSPAVGTNAGTGLHQLIDYPLAQNDVLANTSATSDDKDLVIQIKEGGTGTSGVMGPGSGSNNTVITGQFIATSQ